MNSTANHKMAKISRCLPKEQADALSLVFADQDDMQRLQTIATILENDSEGKEGLLDLWLAKEGDRVVGAMYAQKQPGKTAILWPPGIRNAPKTNELPEKLAAVAVDSLDRDGIVLSQVLLSAEETKQTSVFEKNGFVHLTDLLFLTGKPEIASPVDQAQSQEVNNKKNVPLAFVPYEENQLERLKRIIELTYVESLDCPGMEGMRNMQDVVEGYQAAGEYDAARWFFAQASGKDIGVLLLTAHTAGHWELLYMGVTPEARGNKYGIEIARWARHVAAEGHASQVVLAVDSQNAPACEMYRQTGYIVWDRRKVLIRRLPSE